MQGPSIKLASPSLKRATGVSPSIFKSDLFQTSPSLLNRKHDLV